LQRTSSTLALACSVVARTNLARSSSAVWAQMGIFALMVHEGLDGKPYIINELFGLGQPY